MPSVPYIVQKRELRREKARRSPAGRVGFGLSVFVSLLAVFLALGLIYSYTLLTRDLPSPDGLAQLLEPPYGLLLQPTRLLDSTGEHELLSLSNPAAGERKYLPLEKFPATLVKATIASMDPSFWSNAGYSLSGVRLGSHPTLAQKLVSDNLLIDEPAGMQRNLRERLLAAQLTARYGREKVLEWYFNSAQYGPLVYGAEQASRVYFNKPAAQLSLAEASFLAAVAQAPDINPVDAPQIALTKQKEIVRDMLLQGLITAEEARDAIQAKIELRAPVAANIDVAPAFTRLVMQQLDVVFGEGRLERGGFLIRTTINYDLQVQAECAARIQLARLAGQPEKNGGEDGSCQAARLLPTLNVQTPLSGSASAQLIILEPNDGRILALVGGKNSGEDPVSLPGHSPGSLLTPFIYLTSFTRGMSPSSLVWDTPSGAVEQEAGLQSIYHGPARIRTALANDYLAAALRMLQQLGSKDVARTIQQLGISTLDPASMDKEISSSSEGEVTLLEISRAYGAFANQGILAGQELQVSQDSRQKPALMPLTVLSVKNIYGSAWLRCEKPYLNCSPRTRSVVSPQLAYLMDNVLSDESIRWSSLGHPNPLEIGRPAGAKIGAGGFDGSAWTIGFTPQLLVGVWVGEPAGENDSTSTNISGPLSLQAQGAAGIWHAVLQYAVRDLPVQDWKAPANITDMAVCDPSGMLPTAICPTVVDEVFISGNEPTSADKLYQVFQVNRETGRLASIFTPPGLVEDRVYMVVPPEAAGWARQTGLPSPPDAYDVIYSPPRPSPNVQIVSPAMFSAVSGKLSITGIAQGDGFSFYRLQIGKGLNPREWIQLGQDKKSPVKSGLLGEWDTRGLSGLYALQLLVVSQDQRIESTFVQVTVDNQAPEVNVLYPVEDQVFYLSRQKNLALQSGAVDDLALNRVEFYMDGKLLATFSQGPFTLAWKALPGKHSFLVKAYDLANNSSESTVDFIVK